MKLKEMFGKAKTWTMEHKKEILIAVAGVAGGVVVYKIVGGNILRTDDCRVVNMNLIDGEVGVGTLNGSWKENGYVNVIVNELSTDDIGKLGESLVEKLGDVVNTNDVSAVISIAESVVETN